MEPVVDAEDAINALRDLLVSREQDIRVLTIQKVALARQVVQQQTHIDEILSENAILKEQLEVERQDPDALLIQQFESALEEEDD